MKRLRGHWLWNGFSPISYWHIYVYRYTVIFYYIVSQYVMKTRRYYYVTIRGAKKQFSSTLADSDIRVTLLFRRRRTCGFSLRIRIDLVVSRQKLNVICIRSKFTQPRHRPTLATKLRSIKTTCTQMKCISERSVCIEFCHRSSELPNDYYTARDSDHCVICVLWPTATQTLCAVTRGAKRHTDMNGIRIIIQWAVFSRAEHRAMWSDNSNQIEFNEISH